MEAKCGADCRKCGCEAPRGCSFGKRCFDNGADPEPALYRKW